MLSDGGHSWELEVVEWYIMIYEEDLVVEKQTLYKIMVAVLGFTIIIAIVTSVTGLPINTDNAWIGYWGAILGGFMTLVGVKITVDVNEKNTRESRNQAVLPVFVSYNERVILQDMKYISKDTCVYCIYDIAQRAETTGNPFVYYLNGELVDESPTAEEFDENYLALKYTFTNIGCGSAINFSIVVDSMTPETYIGIQTGHSYDIILLLQSKEGNVIQKDIEIYFENVYGQKYYQKESIYYQKIEDCIVNIRKKTQPIGLSSVKKISE